MWSIHLTPWGEWGVDGFTGCDGWFGKKTCQNLNAVLKGPLTDSCAVGTCCKAGDI